MTPFLLASHSSVSSGIAKLRGPITAAIILMGMLSDWKQLNQHGKVICKVKSNGAFSTVTCTSPARLGRGEQWSSVIGRSALTLPWGHLGTSALLFLPQSLRHVLVRRTELCRSRAEDSWQEAWMPLDTSGEILHGSHITFMIKKK